jgi:ribosomal protein S18 acetylase RimI-like enzyme
MILIRPLQSGDRQPLANIIRKTGVFTEDEVHVALELIDIVLTQPHQRDYQIYSAEEDSQVLGYYCIGPTPMTVGTFDLYWIAVDPSIHNKGVGRQLLRHCENLIREQSGRLVVAETSSQPKYHNTRQFYIRNDYTELTRIKDYYKIGDDLVIYGKYVSQSPKVNP